MTAAGTVLSPAVSEAAIYAYHVLLHGPDKDRTWAAEVLYSALRAAGVPKESFVDPPTGTS